MIRQLALNVRPRDGASFLAYHAGPNEAAVHALESFASKAADIQQAYVWGAPGTGKSHLLQAVCHSMHQLGRSCVYLPLAQFESAQAEVLDDLAHLQTVCIDDIDAIAGSNRWERGLFNLINGLRQAGHRLLLASKPKPAAIPFGLADLKSRLTWGPVFHLKALDDEAKLAALKTRAGQRGLELKDEVGRFLLNNYQRDLSSLLSLFSRLDEASLAAQRRLTIPFIKSVLNL
jgi:DnaA family protein